jgi:SAM-dependent methyltransferase
MKFDPVSVLEVGPGPGVFKTVSALFGVNVETLDIDSELKPDHVGSATNLPFDACAFDVVCSFQMLEHLPYDLALCAFKEMVRVSRQGVVVSIPDAGYCWRCLLHIPKIGKFSTILSLPLLRNKRHVFDGEHHWELNKKGYELKKVVRDMEVGCSLVETYRVFEHPFHRFLIFVKK